MALDYAARFTNAEEVMVVLRDQLYSYDLKLLAVRVGVSVRCLQAIRSGRTRWPRPTTFFSLIDVLGFELILRRKQ